MTDEDKALVERLEEWALTLLAACEGGDLGTDEPAALMYQSADRIEAQAAEIEKLREALQIIAEEIWGEPYNVSQKRKYIARAALGETK